MRGSSELRGAGSETEGSVGGGEEKEDHERDAGEDEIAVGAAVQVFGSCVFIF